MKGNHILASFDECKNKSALFDENTFNQITQIVQESGLTVMLTSKVSFREKPDDIAGYSGVVIISESHCSVHTWPELGKVDMDIFTCNVTRDNSGPTMYVFMKLLQLFKPGRISAQWVER